MKSAKTSELLALGFVAFLLLAPVFAAGYYVFLKHQWAQSRLEELEPRHARLQGVNLQREDISQALAQAASVNTRYVYPATQSGTLASNAAQQRIRDILGNAGLQINSSQVLASKSVKGYEHIPLTVRAEGEWLAVQSVLAVLSSQTPAILVDEFEVQLIGTLAASNPKFQPRLAVYFALSILREQP